MGGPAGIPAINEVVFFLNEFAPGTAAKLAQKSPEYAALLQSGVIGGQEEEPSEIAKTKGVRVRCEILKEALREAVSKADERSTAIQSKLKTLRRLRFFASVCSAVAAMGAAGSALMGEKEATVILSLFSLAANIANAASAVLILGTGKKEDDLVDVLRKLAHSRSYASLTASHLTAAADGEFPVSEAITVLKDANTHYRDLTKALIESIF